MLSLPNQDELVFANKPAGISTHSPDGGKTRGLCEWLAQQNNKPLWPIHRLDKLTSGAILFAENQKTAQKFHDLFVNKKVEKEYLLITENKPIQKKWTINSYIEKTKDGTYSSHLDPAEFNSTTHFEYLKSYKNFHLVLAKPITGKTHQIRLHAKNSSLPILGDTLYGGRDFFRLMLHSQKISWTEFNKHEINPDVFFTDLNLLENSELCFWISEIEKRKNLFNKLFVEKNQCLRLIHSEYTPLRVDKLGSKWVLGWWDDISPTQNQLATIKKLLEFYHVTEYSIEFRGKKQVEVITSNLPQTWVAEEESIKYIFKSNNSLNHGLFLDQREQRTHIQKSSIKKKILNLFAYTGGFSLNAAQGGAEQVTTVDLSQNYIDWTKENFYLNNISISEHKFYAWDSIEFLNWAKKKNLKYDTIICDPPSFSRHKNKTWQIDRDWQDLFVLLASVLNNGGTLVFSTNYQKWQKKDWKLFQSQIVAKKWLIIKEFYPSWDFHFDDQFPLMKSILLKKNF